MNDHKEGVSVGRLESFKKWKAVILSTVLFVTFMILVLPTVAKYSAEAIGVSESPDMSFGSSAMGLYELAEAYGEEGRRIYVILRWTFDLIWPLVYGWLLYSWMKKLSEILKLKGAASKIYWLSFVGVIFDYLENIGATITMVCYPTRIQLSVLLTPYISMIKWGSIGVGFLVWFALLAMVMWQKQSSNRH